MVQGALVERTPVCAAVHDLSVFLMIESAAMASMFVVPEFEAVDAVVTAVVPEAAPAEAIRLVDASAAPVFRFQFEFFCFRSPRQ